MDPITLLGVAGSIASIISLFRKEQREFTEDDVVQAVVRETETVVIQGDVQAKVSILNKVSEDELKGLIKTFIGISDINEAFLKRIEERCLKNYRAKVDDHDLDEMDLDDEYALAKKCVCENIQMARRNNGGTYPSDHFKELARNFGCLA